MPLRSSRLSSPAAFKQVLNEGKHWRGSRFAVAALAVPGEEKKFGVSVARSVGTAVTRNRWKRWMREIFRLHRAEMKPGFRLVVLIRRGSDGVTYRDVEKELLELLKKAGLCA